MAEIVKIWKENNVDRVEFQFSCGGDSMNDTSILIYDKEDNLVSNFVKYSLKYHFHF